MNGAGPGSVGAEQSEGLTRRALLRSTGTAALALSVPGLLAACGRTTQMYENTSVYGVLVGEEAPRTEDLVPLITRRARALGMSPILSKPSGAEALRVMVTPGPYSPATNKASVPVPVVFAASEAARLEPIAAEAISRGVGLIPYPVAMRNQTAAIVYDAARAASELAARVGRHLQGPADVLLMLPPPESSQLPLSSQSASIERAWRATLARQAPGLRVAGVVRAAGEALGGLRAVQGLRSFPRTRVILCWEDQAAIGAARTLRGDPPPELAPLLHQKPQLRAGVDPGDLLIGCMGAPAPYTRATFEELESGGPFQLMVTARARDLANAMVDLPHALLQGESIKSLTLPLSALTPGSELVAEFSGEYLAHESKGSLNYQQVPLNGRGS